MASISEENYEDDEFGYDLSELMKATQRIQTEFQCTNCKNLYEKFWCKEDHTFCYFCTHFLPMRDTYASILKDIDIWYLKSGEISRVRFYNNFLNNLKKWSDKFHVFPTAADVKIIEELRMVQDWSREDGCADDWY